MAAANPIPEHIKVAIIQGLACFDGIATVAEHIKTEYGMVVSMQAIEAHDPTKRAGKKLAQKWRTLFEETRANFIADTAAIPIAHKATRLRALQRMIAKTEKQGNMALAAKLLEQAAKEVGNAFTNKVDHTSSDGSMSPPGLTQFMAALKATK